RRGAELPARIRLDVQELPCDLRGGGLGDYGPDRVLEREVVEDPAVEERRLARVLVAVFVDAEELPHEGLAVPSWPGRDVSDADGRERAGERRRGPGGEGEGRVVLGPELVHRV